MKIVVLDAHTLNPGDLSWKAIAQFGEVTLYERTTQEQVLARSKEAAIILTNKVALSREILQQLPQLKFIAVTATGYNVVDVHAAKELGIPVSNVAGYGTTAVAQHVSGWFTSSKCTSWRVGQGKRLVLLENALGGADWFENGYHWDGENWTAGG